MFLYCVSPADNHTMASHSAVSIRILDVNDNPPELATPYEASICEDSKPGQVRFSMWYYIIHEVKLKITNQVKDKCGDRVPVAAQCVMNAEVRALENTVVPEDEFRSYTTCFSDIIKKWLIAEKHILLLFQGQYQKQHTAHTALNTAHLYIYIKQC